MSTAVQKLERFALAALLSSFVCAPAYAEPNVPANVAATRGSGSTNEFGKTNDYNEGRLDEDVYTHKWYCDTTIPSKSVTGCEVGKTFRVPPTRQFDPLYITVPLGFTVPPMNMQCPQGLVCVDHPPTIDLSAIRGPAEALTPGHDHFTTTDNGGVPEFWNVVVVGVTSRATYDSIAAHRSAEYIFALIKNHDPHVTKLIPTNLFLYFAVLPVGR